MDAGWYLTLLVSASFTVTGGTQPNIVFILADDLGYADVGYHGSEIRTPNIDALAAAGVKLENYYVQPICTPTRSQLLSGRYQIHTGLQHNVIKSNQKNALPLNSATIGDLLQGRGYKTHMVGKWHLGFYKTTFMPSNRGFDSFYGYLVGAEDYYTHIRCHGVYCGFDFYNNLDALVNETGTYSTYLLRDKAIDIIANHDQANPLFLYIPFQAVHSPVQVPSEYYDQYSDITDETRRTYAGMTTCMDDAIGNITAALTQYGLVDNTIIVFSSDNGGQPNQGGYNWPLRGEKGTLWDGAMKAVGFVNSPLLVQKSVTTNELIHVSDWYPTLVELAGTMTNKEKRKLDGIDQWNVISEGEKTLRTELLHNIDPLMSLKGDMIEGSPFDNRIRASIRVGDYKLITGDAGEASWIPIPDSGESLIPDPDISTKNLWLFDVIADPKETDDLSADLPDTVTMMLERLAYHQSTAVKCRFPPEDPAAAPALHNGVWGPWDD